jgi:hypothetical protein
MERKDEVLWRKLGIEVPERGPKPRRASTDRCPYEATGLALSSNYCLGVGSPTFRKPRSLRS